MATIGETIEQLQKLSNKLNALGDKMLEEAFARLKKGEIERAEFFEINDNVQKIYDQSAPINDEILSNLGRQIDAPLEELRQVTEELKQSRKKLDKAENITEICTKAVAAAALVVSSIAAPNPGSIIAAISAVSGIVVDIAAN